MNLTTPHKKFSPLPLIKKVISRDERLRQAQLAIAKKPQS
jgi:hypothetical protein